MKLQDKVALITGSGRGIGRAIALRFADEGASIVVNSVHKENSDAVKKEIESRGGRAISVPCDVSKKESVDGLFETVQREYGSIDVLVNNAGINIVKPAMEMTEANWDDVFSTNLKSIFLCSKAAAALMIPKGSGQIINISSIVGINPFPNRAPYATSKAGVIMLTRELAIEWARHNITVNAIAPGFILTDMLKGRIAEGAINGDAILKRVPLRRFGLVEDIAHAVLFLADEGSSYITGQCITVDGGYTAYGFVE
ncbi:MAG: SDR family oxidoreductase [Thaumarchaeota archaeon]|nr:SDR family oxidoreductase [Nitrososphaerota archaeon]